MPIGLKGNTDGSGAIQIGGSDAISISTGLNTTFAGTITATGTVAGTTGTLYPLVSGTAVASTSGTAIDFTGIPSWVRRITVMLSSVSTNGTSPYIIQLGDSGGIETTSYLGSATRTVNASSADVSNFTSGFILTQTIAAASSYVGTATLTLHNASTNLWNFVSAGGLSGNAVGFFSSGEKALSATLDRVRITTAGGTDTFDAGTINLLWE